MSTTYDYRKYAVLYVDDEEQALKYFRKALEKDFTVLTATSVNEANALLDKQANRIGIVITDQRMPGQMGVELLKRVCTEWPNMVRLLITAYSDIESAIEAVNSGSIYKYITKPADLNELRQTLLRAMELFLIQSERDMLLKERLDVIQRMVVADRVRSLAAMAGGISHHLRNSMTALTCFLEETAPSRPAQGAAPAAGTDPDFAQQLWELAQKEREHLVQIVRSVGQTWSEVSSRFNDEIETADLVKRAVEAADKALAGHNVSTALDSALPRLKADATDAGQALRILLSYTARHSTPAGRLSVAARPDTVAGAPGVRFIITGEGPAWTDQDVAAFFTPFAFPASDPSDLGLELLAAFSIAYQHGGDILVNKSAPAGPGFEILLPTDPSQVKRPDLQDRLMEKLFTHFPSPTALQPNPSQQAA